MKRFGRKLTLFLICAVFGCAIVGMGASAVCLRKGNCENCCKNSAIKEETVATETKKEEVSFEKVSAVVRDVMTEEEIRAGEENTIIESIKFVGENSADFFAGAVISEKEESWLENSGEQMPEYSASAEEGKWQATLLVGEENYSLSVMGSLISNSAPIKFPDTMLGYRVVGIENLSFEGATLITSVTLPRYLTFIGKSAFAGCTGITEFSVRTGNTSFATVDGVLYNYALTRLVSYPLGKTDTVYNVLQSLVCIPAGSFVGSKVQQIVFAEGQNAFVDEEYTESFSGSVLESEHDVFIKTEAMEGMEYSITYYDGGAEDGIAFTGETTGYPSIHTYGTKTVLPSGVYKEDANAPMDLGVTLMVGWYDNFLCEGKPIEVLEADAYTSDITLYAKWDVLCELNGDEENPVMYVDSPVDLVAIMIDLASADEVVSQDLTILQTANIDFETLFTLFEMSSVPYSIGTDTAPFAGTYDGQGYEIRNLAITSEAMYIGLFGATQGATIKNVVLESGAFSTVAENPFVGGIVGMAFETTIENSVNNISFEFEFSGFYGVAGGIVGCGMASTIKDCVNNGSIVMAGGWVSYNGGIVGMFNGHVEGCVNNGDVNAASLQGASGGVVGLISDRSMLEESATGIGEASIKKSVNNGALSGCATGGVAAAVVIGNSKATDGYPIVIEECANYGDCVGWLAEDTSGGSKVGGVAGGLSIGGGFGSITVKNCHNQGNLTGTADEGGIGGLFAVTSVDTAGTTILIEDCYTAGGVSGFGAAGITSECSMIEAGQITIQDCYWKEVEGLNGVYNAGTVAVDISTCSAQTEEAIKSGTLSGLSDQSIWCYIDGLMPFLVSEKTTENGIVYASGSKWVIVDIEEDFDGNKSVIPHNVKAIAPGAFSGANAVNFESGIFNIVGVYTDSAYQNEYTGNIKDATQMLHLKWNLPVFVITYLDQGGEEFSGVMPLEYPTVHTYGEATTLPVPTKEGSLFAGWFVDSGCATGEVSELGAKKITENVTLYAKWFDGLSIDEESGKIAIDSVEGLKLLSELVKSGTKIGTIGKFSEADYIQTADLDFESVENALTPIGTDDLPFEGTYDGNGFVIKGLVINLPSVDNVGVFGFLNDATVSNVIVESGSVIGNASVGGVIGRTFDNVTVSGCVNYATVTGSGFAGGVIGQIYCVNQESQITKCLNYGVVSGSSAGGIAGYAYAWRPVNISQCANAGAITGSNGAGGIFGSLYYQRESVFEQCANIGTITGNRYAGGICGNYEGSVITITNCYNQGNVTANGTDYVYAGGISGSELKATSCYSTGTVAAPNGTDAYIGGIVGSARYAITNCYWLNVDGTLTTAVGSGSPTLTNCVAVTAEQLKGGSLEGLSDTTIWSYDGTKYPRLVALLGFEPVEDELVYNEEGEYYEVDSVRDLQEIASLVNEGNETYVSATYKQTKDIDFEGVENALTPIGNETNMFKGTYDGQGFVIKNIVGQGLFGGAQGATIMNVIVESGTFTGFSMDAETKYAGGIVCGAIASTIKDCYSGASVAGTMAGGILGVSMESTVINCINAGAVGSLSDAEIGGGIVGLALASPIVDCVNKADVSGVGYVGGVVGYGAPISITGCVNYGFINGMVVGGVVGYGMNYDTVMNTGAEGPVTITECHNVGIVMGLEGTGESIDILSGMTFGVGGIVGLLQISESDTNGTYSYEISYCSNYGECINSLYAMGGIVGSFVAIIAESPLVISYCHNNANLSNVNSGIMGGIAGLLICANASCVVTNSYSSGQLTCEAGDVYGVAYAAPFIGDMSATFTNCYWMEGSASLSGLEVTDEEFTIENCSAQTEANLRSGTLEGLNDDKWNNISGCYPTLQSERLTENGIVYLSPSKEVIVDITADFDPSVSKISYLTKVVFAGALEGSTDVAFDGSFAEFVGAYTDAELQNAYSSDLASATVDIYLKWQMHSYDIIYKDVNGEEFSGKMPDGYPEGHTYGMFTTLPVPTKNGSLFDGWYLDEECTARPVKNLGATGYTSSVTVYAKWFEGLSIDEESGKIAVDSAETLIKIAELISTGKSLSSIGTFASADYIQTADIDFEMVENALAPLGTQSFPFAGTFDGNGFKIYGLVINLTTSNVGLFGYLGDQATISNIILESGSITGVGNVGGIVGWLEPSGTGYILIKDCVNKLQITGTGDYVGGIVGYSYGQGWGQSTIQNCVNYGNVSTSGDYVGGIAGFRDGVDANADVENSTNHGDVSGGTNVGGIVGAIGWSFIENCVNNGNITGVSNVGGIIGADERSMGGVSDCTDNGTVTETGATESSESQAVSAENVSVVSSQEPSAAKLATAVENNESSSLKIFGLSVSGIFVLFTIFASKNKKRKANADK